MSLSGTVCSWAALICACARRSFPGVCARRPRRPRVNMDVCLCCARRAVGAQVPSFRVLCAGRCAAPRAGRRAARRPRAERGPVPRSSPAAPSVRRRAGRVCRAVCPGAARAGPLPLPLGPLSASDKAFPSIVILPGRPGCQGPPPPGPLPSSCRLAVALQPPATGGM